jgi:hypothetical protein
MTRTSILAASIGLVLAILSAAQAADAPAKTDKSAKAVEPAKPAIEVIAVTIHPAAAARPALKYHLLPTFLESTPGDAVPLYAKALVGHVEGWLLLRDEPSADKNLSSDFSHFEDWLETPLDKLPHDRARRIVDFFGGGIRTQLEQAVRREHCNWDVPLRQGRAFEVLLPEIQRFREMARILALRARLQIAEGKYADAVASLQVGYGMARHVGKQPFVVCNLVDATIAHQMNTQLLTLCQRPGAPSFYWSIVELPSPWIDRETAIGAEYDGLYLEWPELQHLRHAQYTPEQWNLVLRKAVSDLSHLEIEVSNSRMSDKERAAKIDKTIAHALDGVSRAKTEMLAAGYAQKELDAMPPAQIVMLYSLDTYDAIRDEIFKWWRLPYPQARDGMARADREIPSAMKKELVPMAASILPAVSAALSAFGRTDREFAAIRCIEALRLYAAAHDGELPATLDEIKEVPIPLNPLTGKPFAYHLEGKTAVLDADGLTRVPTPQYRVSVVK